MSKATADLAEFLHIHNAHQYSTALGGDPPFVYYRAGIGGRAPLTAAWQVIRAKHQTDTAAYWRDQYAKTFNVYPRHGTTPAAEKEAMRLQAIEWASTRYHIESWARTPFGSYMPADHVARMTLRLREAKRGAA
jgi:hypothetical protein